MSLLGSLNTASAGLAATSIRSQTASSNIANVSTPGYVRREAYLTQTGDTGVTVGSVNRTQDLILLQSRRDAQSQTAHSDVLTSTIGRSVAAFGQPGSQSGLFGSFTQFESDLQTLRNTPESSAAQQVAVGSLRGFVQSVSSVAQNIQSERTSADSRLGTEIDQANAMMRDLYELNASIRGSSERGNLTAGLLDQRDQVLDSLNASLPIVVTYDQHGAASVKTPSGLTLVGATVHEIQFSTSGRTDSTDASTEAGGRLVVPTVDGISLSSGSGIHGLHEGRIAAFLELRDETLPAQTASLDQFAFDMASALQAAGEPLLLDNGNPVDPLTQTGLSERLTLNPLVDPSRGGDPALLRDGLAAVAAGAPSDDANLSRLTEIIAPFAERLGEVINDATTVAYRAERIHAGNQAREVTLVEAEQKLTAVDLDYELQSLLMIEQAYTANARVIQTVSDMLDTLMSL